MTSPVRRLEANGLEAWAQVKRGFEGYVAKDEASGYQGGPTARRSGAWSMPQACHLSPRSR